MFAGRGSDGGEDANATKLRVDGPAMCDDARREADARVRDAADRNAGEDITL